MAKTKKRIISIFLVLAITLTLTVNAMAGSISNYRLRTGVSNSKVVGYESTGSSYGAITLNITYNSANAYLTPMCERTTSPMIVLPASKLELRTGGVVFQVSQSSQWGSYSVELINYEWETYVSASTGVYII
jgi:hypothetical protein